MAGAGMRTREPKQRGGRRISASVAATAALGLVGIVAALDYLTGYEISFSLFYLVPIYLAAWQSGRHVGLLVCFVSAVCWLLADVSWHSYSRPFIPYWNATVRLGFFVAVSELLVRLKESFERRSAEAREDYLTALPNARAFFEFAELEVARARRYGTAFTVAYIDVDDFKAVNDTLGHLAGDDLLRRVGGSIREHTRAGDVVARMGGDEFAILFPFMGREQARLALPALQKNLQQTTAVPDVSIGFSIGAVTCLDGPPGVEEIIRRADDLMYTVKGSGKNGIGFAVIGERRELPPNPDLETGQETS